MQRYIIYMIYTIQWQEMFDTFEKKKLQESTAARSLAASLARR